MHSLAYFRPLFGVLASYGDFHVLCATANTVNGSCSNFLVTRSHLFWYTLPANALGFLFRSGPEVKNSGASSLPSAVLELASHPAHTGSGAGIGSSSSHLAINFWNRGSVPDDSLMSNSCAWTSSVPPLVRPVTRQTRSQSLASLIFHAGTLKRRCQTKAVEVCESD
jgi:hypothetical protein